jgi:NitT/TauT family transport system ATP-binding protein
MELQRTKTKSERADRAQWAIDLVGLSQFRNHYPSQLSGGMQQRVNLARALATEPQVLLMDEPFGALDAMTKERMQEQLIEITQRTGQAVVFITHDISEAIYLADRVVVMGARPGHVKAIHDVEFDRPRSAGITETEDFQMLRHEIREQLEAEIGAAAA